MSFFVIARFELKMEQSGGLLHRPVQKLVETLICTERYKCSKSGYQLQTKKTSIWMSFFVFHIDNGTESRYIG